MDALLNSILGQMEGSLGIRPAGVPDKFRKIRVKGMPFHISRYVADGCCNVAVMEVNILIMKMFAVIVTPFDKQAPLVCLDVVRVPRKTKYICEVYEFDGPCYAPRYENIVSDYLDVEPLPQAWYSNLLTFVKHFKGLPGHQGKKQCECFIREFVNRTCGIYSDADIIGAPGCEERDRQIGQIREYAHGLIEKGGVSTDAFKTALSTEQITELYDTVLFRAVE